MAYFETLHITKCIPITPDSLRMTPALPGRPVGRAVRNFSHEIGNGVTTSGANKGWGCELDSTSSAYPTQLRVAHFPA